MTHPTSVLTHIPAGYLTGVILIFTVSSRREVSYLEGKELIRLLLCHIVLYLYLLDLFKVLGHEFQFYEFAGRDLRLRHEVLLFLLVGGPATNCDSTTGGLVVPI